MNLSKQERRDNAQQFLQAFSNRRDWLVLDTETTGQDPGEDEVVEIAVLTARGEVLVDKLVRPKTQIDEAASEVHGIYWDDVERKPHITGIRELPFLLTGHPVLVYNKDFDMPIIRNSILNAGGEPMAQFWDPRCVMKAYAMACGDWNEQYGSYSWVSLEGACIDQGIEIGEDIELHRARGDAELTRRLVHSF
ncbi:3'-5' exonuclease [Salinibacter ruber]|uniref:DNA polymerase-3 subunit epsilon n=1 Tax=Salinibacter ruber TaxID=146919 RepID=A0A9X2TGD0_9BACT|nr:3'-5' exonuclease [Salinibacter ruber]MCS3661787.1 DNA polymerase-3 subunit epsilon [Salinibacter ruber]MCS3711552.1 DNA polymerase-3 subunit epsilon [Salinibacter ruber]